MRIDSSSPVPSVADGASPKIVRRHLLDHRGFSEKMPGNIGLWVMACGEGNYETVAVAITNNGGVALVVHAGDISGGETVERVHNNLDKPIWRFLA